MSSHLCDENTGERTARKFGGGHFPTIIDWFFFFARRTIELRIHSSQVIYLPKKGSIQMTRVLKSLV